MILSVFNARQIVHTHTHTQTHTYTTHSYTHITGNDVTHLLSLFWALQMSDDIHAISVSVSNKTAF